MSNRPIVFWCLLRILPALMLFAPHLGCDNGKKTPPAEPEKAKKTSPAAEECPPPAVWSETSVAGVEIAAAEPNRIAVKTLDIKAKLPNGAEAVGPVVSIEPEAGVAPPQRIRMRLPDGVSMDPDRQKRVALACYSVSFSTSHNTLSGAWYTHVAKYDPATRTVEAPVSHASAWSIIITIDESTEVITDHFHVHAPIEIPLDTVYDTAKALEKSYSQLEGFGLRFGRGKTNRLNVYFREISGKKGDVVYGGHQLSKTGGTFIVLNLPSKIPGFSIENLRASAGHELFHELQFKYQNISTIMDVQIPGLQKASTTWYLNPTGWLTDKVFGLPKYDYPLGWLNEAMSTWFQLRTNPEWQPAKDDTLYGCSYNFLTDGLGSLNTEKGYGGAVFIDHMVARCGPAFIRETLEACQRQGRKRNALAAVKEACLKLAVARQDPSLAVFDDVWFNFASNLLLEDAKPPFDKRVNRNQTVTARKNAHSITLGKDPVRVQSILRVQPLGICSQAFRISKMGKPAPAKVACEIRLLPGKNPPCDAKTALFHTNSKPGPLAPLPTGSVFAGILTDEEPSKTIIMELDKAHPRARLVVVAVGLWGGNVPKAGVARSMNYELIVTPLEDGPKDVDTFFPEVKYFPGHHAPWQVSKGKISDKTTGKLRSANRTYFYREFVQGGRPNLLHILRVVVQIKEATPLAKEAFDAKLKALKADKRVVGLRDAGITGKSVAFAMKGVAEFYDKTVQTRDVVVFQEDRNLVEISWSSFKSNEPWGANRRAITLDMAREVAKRIRGTFRGVLPEPPGGNAMNRAQADAANIEGPDGVSAVTIYGLSLAHASTQRFHEPWFDQLVELQAKAEKETARLAAIARTIKPLTKIPTGYADTDALIKAMQERKELLEAKQKKLRKDGRTLSVTEKIELAKYDERLAAIKRVAANATVVKQIEKILFPSGKVKSYSGEVGDSFLKSLGAPRLWPDRLNSPDPRQAGNADAVTAAKEKLWRQVYMGRDKVEQLRSHMKSYGIVAEKAVRISKLQGQVVTYNDAVEAYIKRIKAGDYRSCMGK